MGETLTEGDLAKSISSSAASLRSLKDYLAKSEKRSLTEIGDLAKSKTIQKKEKKEEDAEMHDATDDTDGFGNGKRKPYAEFGEAENPPDKAPPSAPPPPLEIALPTM